MQRTLDTLLRDVPLFAGMDQHDLELIAGCAANVRFPAGARLFRRGDPADSFYIVRHGSVALETYVPGRGPAMIETIEPGEVLGWSWLFAPYRWHLDARALTVVGGLGFDAVCLRAKTATDPRLGYELMSRFAQILIERLQWTRLRLIDVYGNGSGA